MLAMAEELTNSMSDQEAEETLQRFDALVRRGEWSTIDIHDHNPGCIHGINFSHPQANDTQ